MKPILQLFSVIIIFTSCNKTISCENEQIIPVFIGFSATDFDTVVLKKFKKGDNFTQVIDSEIIFKHGADSNRVYRFSDTTIVDFNPVCCTLEHLTPDYDWQVILPRKNYILSIAGIESPQTEMSCFMGKCSCSNPVNSMVENRQTVIPVFYQYTRYFNVPGYVNYVTGGYAIFVH